MDRRGFLGAILAAGCAPAIVRASSLMKIVVPTTVEVLEYSGNRLLTVSMITKEALRILEENLSFCAEVNRDFDSQYKRMGESLIIHRPQRFMVN